MTFGDKVCGQMLGKGGGLHPGAQQVTPPPPPRTHRMVGGRWAQQPMEGKAKGKEREVERER